MKSLHISSLAWAPAGEPGSGGGGGILTETKQAVIQTARETKEKLKSATAETAARARDEAGRMAQQKKDDAAGRVAGYSSALHESAKSLEEEDPNIAWFTHRAADRLQGVADYVRTRDFSGLRTDAENVARRHPAAFFGGLFVAGLVLGNVLKASGRGGSSYDSADDSSRDDYLPRDNPDFSENRPGAQTEPDLLDNPPGAQPDPNAPESLPRARAAGI
jgi:hypothetical protein